MGYESLPLHCECGRGPAIIHGVGLTASHQLLVRWQCGGCGKDLYLIKPLADCWRDCPAPDQVTSHNLPSAPAQTYSGHWECNEFDAGFLKSAGIAVAGECE